jgi:hypothetical protein
LENLGQTTETLFRRSTRPLNSSSIPSVLSFDVRESQLQYRLENQSDRPIYPLWLGLTQYGKAIALSAGEESIPGGGTQIVDSPETSVGLGELLVICSSAPWEKTLQVMESSDKTPQKILYLSNPLEVAQTLLQDLHTGSGVSGENYSLDVNTWATIYLDDRQLSS